jgi:predicted amidohydrolase
MSGKFRLSVCQFKVHDEKSRNIESATKALDQASADGAEIAVLPEMFNCPYNVSRFGRYAENIYTGETVKAISETAASLNMYVAAGSVPELSGDRVYNTSILFDRKGQILAYHRKMHLFDINIENIIRFKESDSISAGSKITVADTDLCKFGIAICYDLRFPELFKLMSLAGAKVIIVPAAFNMVTGPAHFELLVRARAVDNQVYIVAAAQANNPDADYKAYGHSMVADPWGRIVCEAGNGTEIISCEINPEFIEKVRIDMPVLKQMRSDVYDLRKISDSDD